MRNLLILFILVPFLASAGEALNRRDFTQAERLTRPSDTLVSAFESNSPA